MIQFNITTMYNPIKSRSHKKIGVKGGLMEEAGAHQELYAPEGDEHVKGEVEEAAHQELYAPEGDGHVTGGSFRGAHQELYAPESDVAIEGDVKVEDGVPHRDDGGEAGGRPPQPQLDDVPAIEDDETRPETGPGEEVRGVDDWPEACHIKRCQRCHRKDPK